jgi:hypothetical protein
MGAGPAVYIQMFHVEHLWWRKYMYDCSTWNKFVCCSSVQLYSYIAFVMIYMGLEVFDARWIGAPFKPGFGLSGAVLLWEGPQGARVLSRPFWSIPAQILHSKFRKMREI